LGAGAFNSERVCIAQCDNSSLFTFFYVLLSVKSFRSKIFFILLICSPLGTFAQKEKSKFQFRMSAYASAVPIDHWARTGFWYKPKSAKMVGIPVGLGLITEFSKGERFTFRIDANYSYNGHEGVRTLQQGTNPNQEIIYTETVDFKRTTQKFRIMAGFNYYYYKKNKVEGLISFQAGFKNAKRLEVRNSTLEVFPQIIHPGYEKTVIPVAARLSAGYKVRLSEHFNFNAELGFGGGPPLHIGFEWKL
jgi:hypothetical protein